jgi:sensor histidine kinase YesM
MGKKLKIFFLYSFSLTIITNSIYSDSLIKSENIYFIKNWEYSFDAEENYKKNYNWKTLEYSKWFGSKQEMDPLLLSSNSKPPIVWIRTKLPLIQKENFYVMRKYFISPFYEIYINGIKTYTYKEFPSEEFIPLLIKLDYAPIPVAKEGDYLYIRTDFLVLFDHAYGNHEMIGEPGDILEYKLRQNLIPILISVSLFLVGIISLFVFFANWKNIYYPLFYFAIMHISFAGVFLGQNDLTLIVFNRPFFWAKIMMVSGLFIPIGILGFFSLTLGHSNQKHVIILQKFNLAFIFLYTIVSYFLLKPEYFYLAGVMDRILKIFIILEFSIIIFLTLRLIKTSIEARILAIGVIILIGFTLLSLVQFYLLLQPNFLPLWGCVFFLITMGYALERDFRKKRMKILELKKELELSQESLHLANLNRLKEKLSPHFFFNSLNTLHAFVTIDSKLAKKSIEALIQNYEFLEDHVDTDLVPFLEEWKFIKVYCKLNEIRFMDRLKIKLKLIGNFDGVLIPPLTIQPLVENSFKHGFRPSENRKWKLELEAIRNGNDIQIEIKDNGFGLNDKIPNFGRSLGNIKYRLAFFFSESSIEIKNGIDSGTILNLKYKNIKRKLNNNENIQNLYN